jgi:hypothetical protein
MHHPQHQLECHSFWSPFGTTFGAPSPLWMSLNQSLYALPQPDDSLAAGYDEVDNVLGSDIGSKPELMPALLP